MDAPAVEQAYMEVAREAGLTVMPSRLLTINGKLAFATERFDRTPSGRVFCHSFAGLLHQSHRDIGILDYGHIAHVMDRLGMPAAAFRQAYARAAFNAAMSVRDDHAKNSAFCVDASETWQLAPAYDLTYMPGPGGYHTLHFADSTGRDPTRADLQKLAPYYHVEENEADKILDEMLRHAKTVGQRCRDAGVSEGTLAPMERRLKEIAASLK